MCDTDRSLFADLRPPCRCGKRLKTVQSADRLERSPHLLVPCPFLHVRLRTFKKGNDSRLIRVPPFSSCPGCLLVGRCLPQQSLIFSLLLPFPLRCSLRCPLLLLTLAWSVHLLFLLVVPPVTPLN